MKTLFVLISFLVVSNSHAYYYYLYPKKSESKTSTNYRYAYPVPKTSEETTFGARAASGFSMTYPESYIHILSHCFGLTTNLEKLVLRGLKQEDKKTKRRLSCYTVGLGKKLRDFTHNGKTAMEIAEESNNHTAIDYMLSL